MAGLSHAGWASPVQGLGPGERTVLWVRGCQRRCVGCISPDLRSAGDDLEPVQRLALDLVPLLAQTRRLTVTGGEPFEQADALTALIAALREQVDVEVMIYTGYRLADLRDDALMKPLLDAVDLLMDGPYEEAAGQELIWRGSDNQQLHLLSVTAIERYDGVQTSTWGESRPMSLQRVDSGTIRIVGIPRRRDLEAINARLSALGYEWRSDAT